MYGVIYVPSCLLQARLRTLSEERSSPVALLGEAEGDRGKARIFQATEMALAQGVEIGMTATQGQARCASLRLLYRATEDEGMVETLLHACAETWTPDFEATAVGACTLDLSGHTGAVSDPEHLGQSIVKQLAQESLAVRVGLAFNPDLALLVATQARPVMVVRPGESDMGAFLSQIPISDLGHSQEFVDVAKLWGIHTLGELGKLPRAALAERLGSEAMALLDRAEGKSRRCLRLVRPPVTFEQSMEFEHAIDALEPLLFVIRRLLETLVTRLASGYLVAGGIDLKLGFEDDTRHERVLRVPDPSRDVDLLFGILHTYLEELTAEAPIVSLTLALVPAHASAHQFDLFKASLRDPNGFSETLARVEALLGEGRVGSPKPLLVHRPDVFAMTPFLDTEEETKRPRKARKRSPLEMGLDAKTSHARLGLPLRRFRPPPRVQVAMAHHRPVAILSGPHQGPIVQPRGPWLISGEWWKEDHWARREWDVQLDATGGLYRLAEVGKGIWELAGVYG